MKQHVFAFKYNRKTTTSVSDISTPYVFVLTVFRSPCKHYTTYVITILYKVIRAGTFLMIGTILCL